MTLLHFRVLLVDDVQTSFPANDFAIGRTLLDGCASFHDALFYFLYLNVMRPLLKS